jgi:hypothetical protein
MIAVRTPIRTVSEGVTFRAPHLIIPKLNMVSEQIQAKQLRTQPWICPFFINLLIMFVLFQCQHY